MKDEQVMPIDYRIICDMVEPDTTVLDLGCGAGDLLLMLQKNKNTKGQGIELSEEAIYACVEKGISVFQSDIERGLPDYPDKSFDYIILNQSMQEVKNVDLVIRESFRVGKKVIIGFPNFAYIRARSFLFFTGKVPVTPTLPYRWYDTPNVHFLSIRDFEEYCGAKNITILAKRFSSRKNERPLLPNLFARIGIYLLTK